MHALFPVNSSCMGVQSESHTGKALSVTIKITTQRGNYRMQMHLMAVSIVSKIRFDRMKILRNITAKNTKLLYL